jgi:hypothetical protein
MFATQRNESYKAKSDDFKSKRLFTAARRPWLSPLLKPPHGFVAKGINPVTFYFE